MFIRSPTLDGLASFGFIAVMNVQKINAFHSLIYVRVSNVLMAVLLQWYRSRLLHVILDSCASAINARVYTITESKTSPTHHEETQ